MEKLNTFRNAMCDAGQGRCDTSAFAHDEAMMSHIKDSLGLSLLLDRSAVALNALAHLYGQTHSAM